MKSSFLYNPTKSPKIYSPKTISQKQKSLSHFEIAIFQGGKKNHFLDRPVKADKVRDLHENLLNANIPNF